MKKEFTNSDQLRCVFTDDGITFCNPKQEVFLPYGCMDSINLSLLGILQATSRARICTFAVARKDRGEVKELMKYAKEAMQNATAGEVQVIDLTEKTEEAAQGASVEEQLAECKMLFVRGEITKEEYDARKRKLKGR